MTYQMPRKRGGLRDISADVSLLELLFLVFSTAFLSRPRFDVLYVQYDVGWTRSFSRRTLGISRSQYIPGQLVSQGCNSECLLCCLLR